MLTATLYKNSVRDFYGLLRFMFVAVRLHIAANAEPLTAAAYLELRKSFVDNYSSNLFAIPKAKLLDYVRALDPDRFRTLIGGEQ